MNDQTVNRLPGTDAFRQARPGSQTAGRALRLLKLLVTYNGPATIAEIAALSGLVKSAAYRLIRELEAHGFVEYDSTTRKYSIGAELIALSSKVLSKVDLRDVARPALEKLVSLTQETAAFNIRAGYNRLSIDGIESPHSIRRGVSLGELLPLYATPSGRAILAFLSEREIDNLLAHAQQENFNREQIAGEIRFAKANGYLISAGERRLGHSVFAVPIFSGAGVVGAITVSGPSERWNTRRIRQYRTQILDNCLEVSRALGYSDTSIAPASRRN